MTDQQENGCPFSERKLEVLRLLVDGHTNRQIAPRVFMSPHTVKIHVRQMIVEIAHLLPCRSRTALAVHAVRNGWA